MKKLILIFSCFCFLSFSISKHANNSNPFQEDYSHFTVNTSLDSAWNKLQFFLFNEKYGIQSQLKIEGNASMRLDLKNAKLSYRDKKSNLIHDTTALALAAVKKRSGNLDYVYPNAGNFQCLITLTKVTNDKTQIIISFDPTCMMTEYIENAYIERRRRTPNVEIQSTGFFEKKVKQLF